MVEHGVDEDYVDASTVQAAPSSYDLRARRNVQHSDTARTEIVSESDEPNLSVA